MTLKLKNQKYEKLRDLNPNENEYLGRTSPILLGCVIDYLIFWSVPYRLNWTSEGIEIWTDKDGSETGDFAFDLGMKFFGVGYYKICPKVDRDAQLEKFKMEANEDHY